ncbi:MAG: SPFH domain-containing protein [Oligoflexus sp.]
MNFTLSELFIFAVWLGLFGWLAIEFSKSFRLVPNRTALIVERLGRYHTTLGPGFHVLVPFLDRVASKKDLREATIDVPPQECFSKDEVKVEVDGVLYISVVDPVKATYGVTNFHFAAMQLAQTTTRSVIGQLDLDKTFEERDLISVQVVDTLAKAGEKWGIMVHRYEVKNIRPPSTVQQAMERQVTAERERRATIAQSEGIRQSLINTSEGQKAEMINHSEGEQRRLINQAEGRAQEILAIAKATAESLEKIGSAISLPGGQEAVQLELAERYLNKVGGVAKASTQVVLPADITDLDGLLQRLQSSLTGKVQS